MSSARRTLQDFKAQLFKALAHPTRVRILECLRLGEQTVSALQAQLGIEGNAVSQQLGVLRANHVVEGRKDGTSVYYRVVDENIFVVLDAARNIFTNHLGTLQSLADEDAVVSAGSESLVPSDDRIAAEASAFPEGRERTG
ncbi:MAG: winged helix-turn-helix transcriptional regulator [Chloroflexi bacterium]|nr:winged helix-turn-helix transcriptional regulator [Chloroflexota bacterium]